jgi:NADPH-dependent curcumin reductase CurA
MKGILYFHEDLHSMVKMFMEMIQLNIKGMEILIDGIEKLPETYRDMIDGKFVGKPLVRFV